MTSPTLTLRGTSLSGHSHRVENLLLMLELPHRYVETPAALRRSPEFLALNPLGEIPVLLDDELVLPDSNAILVYLARRYDAGGSWLPDEAVAAAQVQRWLSIAAGQLTYGPATARKVTLWGRPGDLEQARAIAGSLLRFMDGHLAGRRYLASEQPTIADLACYAYVAHAPEGGVSLAPWAAVREWLARVEALPRFKPMPRSPLPAGG